MCPDKLPVDQSISREKDFLFPGLSTICMQRCLPALTGKRSLKGRTSHLRYFDLRALSLTNLWDIQPTAHFFQRPFTIAAQKEEVGKNQSSWLETNLALTEDQVLPSYKHTLPRLFYFLTGFQDRPSKACFYHQRLTGPGKSTLNAAALQSPGGEPCQVLLDF